MSSYIAAPLRVLTYGYSAASTANAAPGPAWTVGHLAFLAALGFLVLTGVRMPRMSSIIERWVKTLRAELLDRTLMWNQTHLRPTVREYERHYNEHRTHRTRRSHP